MTNWRIKARDRFADPELVAVRYESGLREVFDYHEAICDLIDAARRNEVTVSLLTLARIIHDDEGFQAAEWHERRAWMFASLRAHELIEFEGSVDSIHQPLTIRLPEATYAKWHTDGGAKSAKAKAQPRNAGGKFTAKQPQVQAVPDCGTRNDIAAPQAPRRHDTTDDTTRHDRTADLRPQTARRWQDEVVEALDCLTEGDEGKRNHLRNELWMHARRNNLGDAPHAYVAAAKAFAAKVAGGWKPNRPGGALPYFLSTVTSYRHEITVAEATPDTPKEPSPYDRATRIA